MQQIQFVVQKPGDTAAGVGGADVSIVYPAKEGRRHVLFLIDYSYSATPTGGNLHVHRGDNTTTTTEVLDLDITAAGHGEVGYHMPIAGEPGEAMTVTLKGGGGAVIGKLAVEHYIE